MGLFEKTICKIPLVKILCGSIRDRLDVLSRAKDNGDGGGQAVLVSLEVWDLKMLVFVTRENR